MLILMVGSELGGYGESVASALRQRGIRTECVASGKEALDMMRAIDYDLLLSDLLLPDMLGDEVARMARSAGINTPVMLAAAGATPGMRARALDMGADDFVTLPCDFEELAARVRAIARRRLGHTHSTLTVGCVSLSLDRREVRVRGTKLSVSRREFAVLELLFLRQGVILDKAAIVNHLYRGVDEPDVKSIDVVMCRLRKKLTQAGVASLISTVWGCGYTLQEPSEQAGRGNGAAIQLVA